MRTRFVAIAGLFALLPVSAMAQAVPFEYANLLHAYWKLSPPADYSLYVKDYAAKMGATAGQRKKHELDDTALDGGSAAAIAAAVAEADSPIVLETEVELGQYDTAQGGFSFRPFGPTTYFTAEDGPVYNASLPNITVRFVNTQQIRLLPMPPATAKALLDSPGFSRRFDAEVTFVPTQAKTSTRELRGTITELRVKYPDRPLSKTARTGEVAVLSFDPISGQLTNAEYVGLGD